MRAALVGLCVFLALSGAALADVPARHADEVMAVWRMDVIASYYGFGFHGRRTSCGQVYDQWGRTVASPDLPCGTELRLTNPRNGRSILVTVTDRGPFVRGRALDVSRGVARQLGFEIAGLARLWVEVLR
jgi:rare lipoprotein A